MHGLGRWLHVNKPPSQLALRPGTMATMACSLEAGVQAIFPGSNRTGCTHSAPSPQPQPHQHRRQHGKLSVVFMGPDSENHHSGKVFAFKDVHWARTECFRGWCRSCRVASMTPTLFLLYQSGLHLSGVASAQSSNDFPDEMETPALRLAATSDPDARLSGNPFTGVGW